MAPIKKLRGDYVMGTNVKAVNNSLAIVATGNSSITVGGLGTADYLAMINRLLETNGRLITMLERAITK